MRTWIKKTLSFCWLGTLAACGLPSAPDIRKQFATNVEALGTGTIAVYPLREQVRVGQIWMIDASNSLSQSRQQPFAPGSILISEDLVAPMEKARRERMVEEARLAKSGSSIGELLKADGKIDFVQGDDKPLELAGVPSYTLASIDQETLTGSVPTVFTSINAALGLSRIESLKVRPLAVEVAELPFDKFVILQQGSCSQPGQFMYAADSPAIIAYARQTMQGWWNLRQAESKWRQIPAFQPKLMAIRKVLYLRGLEYVFSSDRATSAAITAALKQNFPEGRTPPVPPAITPPAVSVQTTEELKQASAQIDDLNAKMKELLKNVGEVNAKVGDGINISGSAVRATGEGVSLIQTFDRPLAFGYEPHQLRDLPAEQLDRETLGGLCPGNTRQRI